MRVRLYIDTTDSVNAHLPPRSRRGPSCRMDTRTFRFHELDTLVEDVHAHFMILKNEGALHDFLEHDSFYRLQWAVHEWMANLVQHADFENRTPEIQLQLHPSPHSVHCTIDDNSVGFDLHRELERRAKLLEPLPERGMGLLILESCAQELTYRQLHPTRHRLEFIVSTQQDPWLNIPFSS